MLISKSKNKWETLSVGQKEVTVELIACAILAALTYLLLPYWNTMPMLEFIGEKVSLDNAVALVLNLFFVVTLNNLPIIAIGIICFTGTGRLLTILFFWKELGKFYSTDEMFAHKRQMHKLKRPTFKLSNIGTSSKSFNPLAYITARNDFTASDDEDGYIEEILGRAYDSLPNKSEATIGDLFRQVKKEQKKSQVKLIKVFNEVSIDAPDSC